MVDVMPVQPSEMSILVILSIQIILLVHECLEQLQVSCKPLSPRNVSLFEEWRQIWAVDERLRLARWSATCGKLG